MGLKDVLEKMKLVEADAPHEPPVPSPPPPAAGTRPRGPTPGRASMSEILQRVPAPRADEPALAKAAGGEVVPDFPAIYEASGVKGPAHGFSAYKVLEILSSPDFAALDERARAAALSGFLKMNPAGPVPIADVIQDALARDQALDGFESFLRKKLDARAEQVGRENAALQAEIDELVRRNQEKMEANRGGLAGEKQRFSEWQARKRIEERKLFDAVAPFVEQNPVSVGNAAEAPRPPDTGPARG
ncbi:MAG: hypothetical protein AB7O37_10980 [Vicinamibacteria bacterium]